MQIDQQLVVGKLITAMIQHHRHLIRVLGIVHAMRNKSGGRVMPKQFIQSFASCRIRRTDDRANTSLHGLVAQLTGCAQPVF